MLFVIRDGSNSLDAVAGAVSSLGFYLYDWNPEEIVYQRVL